MRISYFIHVDGDINGDVDEVSQGQAGDEGVGPVPHILVVADDPQQSGVAHHAHHKDDT